MKIALDRNGGDPYTRDPWWGKVGKKNKKVFESGE
jgi:hypothetical protein